MTQPGSAVHQKTSSGWKSSAYRPVTLWAMTASCTCTAPLGLPVVPEVKCSSAMSSGSVRTMSNSLEAACSSAARSRVPSGGAPSASTISMSLRCASSARQAATLRLYSAAEVTRTLPSPMLIRALIGSGPKAENIGQNTAPSFSVPSAAT